MNETKRDYSKTVTLAGVWVGRYSPYQSAQLNPKSPKDPQKAALDRDRIISGLRTLADRLEAGETGYIQVKKVKAETKAEKGETFPDAFLEFSPLGAKEEL